MTFSGLAPSGLNSIGPCKREMKRVYSAITVHEENACCRTDCYSNYVHFMKGLSHVATHSSVGVDEPVQCDKLPWETVAFTVISSLHCPAFHLVQSIGDDPHGIVGISVEIKWCVLLIARLHH